MNNNRIISGLTKVIVDLEAAIQKYPNGVLRMERGEVGPHYCGTTHCFAGWVGVMNQHIFDPNDFYWSFTVAADYIAELCGFEDRDKMRLWAIGHSDIWGNKYGYELFASERAFDNAENLEGIIVHLHGVVSRLGEANNAKR